MKTLSTLTIIFILLGGQKMRSDAAKQAAFEQASAASEEYSFTGAIWLIETLPARTAQKKQQPKQQPQTVTAKVTGYCPCAKCCGKWAAGGANRLTAGGRAITAPNGAAVPKSIAYGAKIRLPDGTTLIADDTGGAMRQSWERGVLHIDRRFSTHREALGWGVQTLAVTIEGVK